jgi:hypothetical protein
MRMDGRIVSMIAKRKNRMHLPRASLPAYSRRICLLALVGILYSCQSKPAATTLFIYEEGDTRRKYAEQVGLFIGTMAKHDQLSGPGGQECGDTIAREFNILWPDSLWRDTEPEEGVFTLDKLADM